MAYGVLNFLNILRQLKRLQLLCLHYILLMRAPQVRLAHDLVLIECRLINGLVLHNLRLGASVNGLGLV